MRLRHRHGQDRILLALTGAALLLAACSGTPASGTTEPPAQASTVVSLGTEPPPPPTPHPFGLLSCKSEHGIRFCQGGQQKSGDLRVHSFDGVPLDADVALPSHGRGPFPLIVLLHGLGGSKKDWENSTDNGGINDTTLASMGYAVLMYTARGFGDSCGTPASRKHTPSCKKGWLHLADQRYEVRDTQYLAGLLVDEGLVKPDIAVAGVSYGAGQALELAMLKNRIRLPDGKFAPWVSPHHHVPMQVAAVYAMWPWNDLVSSLEPNGALFSSTYTPPAKLASPNGVEKQSWDTELYLLAASYYLATAKQDPGAALGQWFSTISKGEPYGKAAAKIAHRLQTYHSAIGIPMPKGGPPPIVLQSGWTDTLFPVSEALDFANRLSAAHVHSKLLMIFDDYGHGWAQGKAADVAFQTKKALLFLNSVMLGKGRTETGVLALGTTCPMSAPSGPLLTGPTFAALQTGHITLSGSAAQRVTAKGGSPSVAGELNPAEFGGPYCNNLSAAREAGTAVYSVSLGKATTLVGGLVVHATFAVKGDFPEVVGRLWDVNTSTGTRQLIEANVYRPPVDQRAGSTPSSSGKATVTFALSPNEYTVPSGHELELELVGSTAPWFRASNGKFTITVTDLTATIGTSSS